MSSMIAQATASFFERFSTFRLFPSEEGNASLESRINEAAQPVLTEQSNPGEVNCDRQFEVGVINSQQFLKDYEMHTLPSDFS